MAIPRAEAAWPVQLTPPYSPSASPQAPAAPRTTAVPAFPSPVTPALLLPNQPPPAADADTPKVTRVPSGFGQEQVIWAR